MAIRTIPVNACPALANCGENILTKWQDVESALNWVHTTGITVASGGSLRDQHGVAVLCGAYAADFGSYGEITQTLSIPFSIPYGYAGFYLDYNLALIFGGAGQGTPATAFNKFDNIVISIISDKGEQILGRFFVQNSPYAGGNPGKEIFINNSTHVGTLSTSRHAAEGFLLGDLDRLQLPQSGNTANAYLRIVRTENVGGAATPSGIVFSTQVSLGLLSTELKLFKTDAC